MSTRASRQSKSAFTSVRVSFWIIDSILLIMAGKLSGEIMDSAMPYRTSASISRDASLVFSALFKSAAAISDVFFREVEIGRLYLVFCLHGNRAAQKSRHDCNDGKDMFHHKIVIFLNKVGRL